MALPVDVTSIDMNDPVNLSFYTQLIRFHGNSGEFETFFLAPDNAQQRMIQSWAHELGFAFEYTLATQAARVIKPSLTEDSSTFETDNLNFLEFGGMTDIGLNNSRPVGNDTLSKVLNGMDTRQKDGFAPTGILAQPHFPPADFLLNLEQLETDNRRADFAPDGEQDDPALFDILGIRPPDTLCCLHAHGLEHTVITALGILDQEIAGVKGESCAITAEILAGKPDDINDVVKRYISTTRRKDRTIHSTVKATLTLQTGARANTPEKSAIGQSEQCENSPGLPLLPLEGSSSQGRNLFEDHGDSASSIGSTFNAKSGRGRKRVRDVFKRRPSVQSPASNTFQEHVFDSKSSRDGSPASGASGRRGPLGAASNAAAKAVKAIRACWRCKFLRKTCSVQNPCLACPKASNKSNLTWASVSCRRGKLAEEMLPLCLCPKSGDIQILYSIVGPSNWEIERLNKESRDRIKSRESFVEDNRNFAVSLKSDNSGITGKLFSSSLPQVTLDGQIRIAPLNECIDSIIQETLMFISCRQIVSNSNLPDDKMLFDSVLLLRFAAQHQSFIDGNQLIAQSLVCLRSSLEAFYNLGVTDWDYHLYCEKSLCLHDCINKLDNDINIYLDHLSRVFFTKENMRAKENWWLSAFYSFCIQAMVRRALLMLPSSSWSQMAAQQYLHLAIRLFIASSGSYDPLMRDYASSEALKTGEASTLSGFCDAQKVVQQSSWVSKGIKSSAEYLQHLFEDEGAELYQDLNRSSARSQSPIISKPSNISDSHTPAFTNAYNFYRTLSFSSMESAGPASPFTRPPPSANSYRPYRTSSLSSMESIVPEVTLDFHDLD